MLQCSELDREINCFVGSVEEMTAQVCCIDLEPDHTCSACFCGSFHWTWTRLISPSRTCLCVDVILVLNNICVKQSHYQYITLLWFDSHLIDIIVTVFLLYTVSTIFCVFKERLLWRYWIFLLNCDCLCQITYLLIRLCLTLCRSGINHQMPCLIWELL